MLNGTTRFSSEFGSWSVIAVKIMLTTSTSFKKLDEAYLCIYHTYYAPTYFLVHSTCMDGLVARYCSNQLNYFFHIKWSRLVQTISNLVGISNGLIFSTSIEHFIYKNTL
jgi:hypothetical protein